MRTSEQITPAEVQAYAKFCIEHGIINDGSQHDQHNADFVLNYFENTWKQDITEKNLETAWDQIRPHLKLYSPAQLEYYKVANQEPDRANQLANWLTTQGKRPGQLVNHGDEAFENLRLLLLKLRGYEISPPRIRDAENRIQSKPGKKLHYVPAARRTEPRSEAAKSDDGVPFLGRDLVKQPDGSYRSKTPAEQRREAEAAERANSSQAQTPTLDASERTWKGMAENLLHDGTHSQQARVKAVYESEEAQGSSWRRVYEACKRETNLYKSRSIR